MQGMKGKKQPAGGHKTAGGYEGSAGSSENQAQNKAIDWARYLKFALTMLFHHIIGERLTGIL